MNNYDKSEDMFIENKNEDQTVSVLSVMTDAKDCDMEKVDDIEIPPFSKRYKIKMNRLFRERVGGTFLPFPDEDNLYEKLRSKLIIKLKTNERLDHIKQRKLNKYKK